MTEGNQFDSMTGGSEVIWFKSTRSGSKANCVEVAYFPGGTVGVRDSKDKAGPVLKFTPGEWSAFVGGVHDGEFGQA
jgi:hypothetical protein